MSYSAAFSQATEIILYISIKLEEKEYKYLSIKGISGKLNIPIPSVKRLIGMLKNEGLITSKTGVSGGLTLQREAQYITLLDIFRAVEGVNKPLFKLYKDFDISKFEHAKQVENQINQLSETLINAEKNMLKVLKNKTIKQIREFK